MYFTNAWCLATTLKKVLNNWDESELVCLKQDTHTHTVTPIKFDHENFYKDN